MTARFIEKAMNLLLSMLMIVLFIIIAPFWTIFYGGLLFRDYLIMASA